MVDPKAVPDLNTASNRLRAKIADRRQKDGAYGREAIPVCLSPDLVVEYNRLQNDKTRLERDAARSKDVRMSGDPEIEAIEAQLEELGHEIQENTATVVFSAMGDKTWNTFRAQHKGIDDDDPKVSGPALDVYFDEMLEKCFLRVDFDGDTTDLKLVDIVGSDGEEGLLSFPQAQEVRSRVQELNVRGVSVPFSLSRSNGRPKTSSKSRRPRASA